MQFGWQHERVCFKMPVLMRREKANGETAPKTAQLLLRYMTTMTIRQSP